MVKNQYLDIESYSLEELKEELYKASLLEKMPQKSGGDLIPHKDKKINENKYLQTVIDIHFDEDYGSPYWQEKMKELDFDPREEIKKYEDLKKLPEAEKEALKHKSVREFIPKLFSRNGNIDPEYFDLSKSSGTKGTKKLMPWSKNISEDMGEWYNYNLELNNQEGGDWLACGPYGLYEKHLEKAGNKRGGLVYFNGIETKELKERTKYLKKISENPLKILNPKTAIKVFQGISHLNPTMKSIKDDIASQNFSNIASAPVAVHKIYDMLKEDFSKTSPEEIDTILISGTGITKESIEEIEEKYRNANIIPMYATSLTGPAFDHPDTDEILYYPPSPQVKFEVVEKEKDFNQAEKADYEERGRVVIHRVGEDFFWPNQTERESAIRIEPNKPFEVDGISKIRPY